tara:strand:- start:3156 stop:4130 length:975 start_codon:yes stop_codon:yes gene_type:complete
MLDNAGDQNELFLKQWAGEVLASFEEACVMMPCHTVRTIASGKSAQFPAVGTANARYHTPGESIIEDQDAGGNDYLTPVATGEITVTINDLLVSGVFVANIDEAKNHWDVRSEYTRQMGFALANAADTTLINYGFAGARATTDRFGNTSPTTYLGTKIDIGDASNGAHLLAGIVDAAQAMDEKNVPANDRFCVMAPAEYYLLVEENKDAINRDYGNDGNGSLASGVVLSVAGIQILKSNHLPTADWTPDAGDLGSASGAHDFVGTAGHDVKALCFQRSALGTVKLMDLSVESEYQVERQGTLMVARYAMGHDVLRHEALVQLAV